MVAVPSLDNIIVDPAGLPLTRKCMEKRKSSSIRDFEKSPELEPSFPKTFQKQTHHLSYFDQMTCNTMSKANILSNLNCLIYPCKKWCNKHNDLLSTIFNLHIQEQRMFLSRLETSPPRLSSKFQHWISWSVKRKEILACLLLKQHKDNARL